MTSRFLQTLTSVGTDCKSEISEQEGGDAQMIKNLIVLVILILSFFIEFEKLALITIIIALVRNN